MLAGTPASTNHITHMLAGVPCRIAQLTLAAAITLDLAIEAVGIEEAHTACEGVGDVDLVEESDGSAHCLVFRYRDHR